MPDYERKRVLLIAYGCSPYRGSESGVGWGRAIETSEHFDTWVICRKQAYEEDIKRYIAEHGEKPSLHFKFVHRTWLEGQLAKIPGFFYIAYHLWHRRAYRSAVRLHKEVHFDLVHHVNWNTFREPGYPWKLGIPFVWGPVGGMENYPWQFILGDGIKVAVTESFRNIANILQFHFSRRVRKAARDNAALLVINTEGCRKFESVHACRSLLMQDIGTYRVSDKAKKFDHNSRPIRILAGSRMEPRYSHHLLLKALHKLPADFECSVKIAGSGSEVKRWRKLSEHYNPGVTCEWMGWLSLKALDELFEWADVFIFTGLRNSTNGMVLQALSKGVPVICLDHQGVGDLVTNNCGIRIPVTNLQDVIFRLRDAIVFISSDRNRLEELSQGAILRARDFQWSLKGRQTAAIYEEIMSHLSTCN